METKELFAYDQSFLPALIAGVDEVGRGPLAGPVVCAAVVLPMNTFIDGIYDSKKVTAAKREKLSEQIKKEALCYSISEVGQDVIDEINILNATKLCMANAIHSLKVRPSLVLVDAVKGLDTNIKTLSIIKGDAKSYHIAAASILAKVYRDRLMTQYDAVYPGYHFANNKGYGTAAHIAGLKELGFTDLHRKTFIKNFIQREGK